MDRNYTTDDINAHYARRHELRGGIYGDKPYANYGYWTRPGMTIDEACDALTDVMAQSLQLNETDRLIEVGCGYAASAVYLASHYHPRQICGVDATEVRIREGKARVAAAGLDQVIDLRLGNATALDFPDASFTKALAIECAFHFDTREKFLAEAFRVLTPGGRLAMTDITPARHIRVSDYSREQLREFLTADLKHIGDANIYDQAEYERILRDLGFVDVELESIKDKVGIQFAEHLEKVAAVSPPENQAPRLHFASTFRNQLMVNGDYVVVRARKPG